jgi:hypothetical protein
MTRYFGLAEGANHGMGPRLTYQQLLDRIDWNTLVRYGRFRLASMGDRVRVADLIQTAPIARDNSFVRVCYNYAILYVTNNKLTSMSFYRMATPTTQLRQTAPFA